MTSTAICRGTDRRDLEAGLDYLLDEKSIHGPTWRLSSLVALATRVIDTHCSAR